ncbi:MAG: histidine phosphatase family protein [Chloroflexi bacterium]|nr:histidine phosphatase family protein [Chloroflexota bacterium]
MGRLLLIRHCETDANTSDVIASRHDWPLSARGMVQRDLLGEFLKSSFEIDRVVASDRTRCLQTAEVIDAPLTETSLLRELDFGDWEGQRWPDIRTKYPEESARLMRSDPGFAPPGGESVASVYARIARTIEEFQLRSTTENVAVVAHGGTLRGMISSILNWPTINDEAIVIFVGSVSSIRTGGDIPGLDLLNYHQHLAPSYEDPPRRVI